MKYHSMAIESDEHLVRRYREEGSKELIGALFERYNKMVFLVCMKYLSDEELAKDAAMQVFESLFTKLRHHEIAAFKSWLYAVTRNHCLGLLRKPSAKTVSWEENLTEVSVIMESVEKEHQKEEALMQLEDAVSRLKPDQRQCIDLFYLQNKRYEEIIRITGFTFKQVKSHIQNGRRNLRILMEKRS
jgi:RNA polymerase sigma factor (sigma-70 family)